MKPNFEKNAVWSLVGLCLLVLLLPVILGAFQGGTGPPLIINSTLTLADTEYTVDMPALYHAFDMRVRSGGNLKCSFASGASGTTYWTVEVGTVWSEDRIRLSDDIYCQSATAGTVVETVAF